MNHANELNSKINSKSCIVGVMGLGYVGLPLIDAYVNAGFKCIGFDVDPKKADTLNNGKTYIAHIKDSVIQYWLDQNQFEATTEMDRLPEADVVLICVPTPLSDSRDPDLTYVINTTKAIAKTLRPWAVDCFREHHLSWHYQGCDAAYLRKIWVESGRRFLLGL